MGPAITRSALGAWLVIACASCAESGGVMRLDGSVVRPPADAGIRPPSRDAATPTPPPPPPPGTLPPGPAPPDDAGVPATCTNAGPYPRVDGVSCTTATAMCLSACGADGACQGVCLDRDPTCQSCVYQNYYACAQTMGCQEEWDAYVCCAEAGGCFEAMSSADCPSMTCPDEEVVVRGCFDALSMECSLATASCFP